MRSEVRVSCFIVLLVLLLGSLPLMAQKKPWYFLFGQDSSKIPALISSIRDTHKAQLNLIPGKDARYAKVFYEEREQEIARQFEGKAVILDDSLNAYLGKLIAPIYQANPSIPPQQLRIFFSRDFVPNACSYGDGTILFNIGLFYRLENEAQAAFVLSHELAHYLLGHSEQQIRKYVNTFYSDSMQQVLKKVTRQEYNGMAEIRKLVEEQMLMFRRHNRENEKQADSMALMLLRNTPYLLNESMSCLSLLDSMDADPYRSPLPLAMMLNFPEFPFRQKWLKREENIFSQVQQVKNPLADSMKTHPDCQLRVQALLKLNVQGKGLRRFMVDSLLFTQLQHKMEMEMAGYAYASGNISRAMYYGLNLSLKYPSGSYPIMLTGACMNTLYDAMVTHKLRTIAELPGLREESQYDAFKVFLENLRASDMAALSYYYHIRYGQLAGNETPFKGSVEKSKTNFAAQQLK